jgi:hypothetical protein
MRVTAVGRVAEWNDIVHLRVGLHRMMDDNAVYRVIGHRPDHLRTGQIADFPALGKSRPGLVKGDLFQLGRDPGRG